MQSTSSVSKLQTINTFLKERDWPTKQSIRWYIHRNVKGFEEHCVRRLGKRIFIDVQAFEAWVQKNIV